ALAYAEVCHCKRLYAASARLYRQAFADDPRLSGDMPHGHRDTAARSAAQAGCGRGEDAAGAGAAERARWRTQALEWLRAGLKVWERRLAAAAPQAREGLRRALGRWQVSVDLACVRDAKALAQLPAAERRDWQRFWAEVAGVRNRAEDSNERPRDA